MFQAGTQPEKENERKDKTGRPVFPGTDPTLYFSGQLLYLRLYIEINGEYKAIQGQSVVETRCFFIHTYKRLRWFYIIFWPGGLLTFYDPFFLIMVSQPEHLFFPRVIFLKPGTTL